MNHKSDELTPAEWQYISVLIATDVRNDRTNGINILADYHQKIWEKIQPFCQWDEEEDNND